jgi:hypothetical protein
MTFNIEGLSQTEFFLAEGQRLSHAGSWAFHRGGFDYWSPELFRIHGLDPSGNPPTTNEYLSLVHRAFTDAAALNRREIDLAGDTRTMPEAAEILAEALGRPIAFAQTPIEQVRQYSKDMALMLEWFERVGYSADIAGLEREFGRALTKLPDWARQKGVAK